MARRVGDVDHLAGQVVGRRPGDPHPPIADRAGPLVAGQVGEVAVIVEDSHPEGLMGIYDPVGGLQRVVVFRDANPNADEVKRTVLHEIGHHFGMNEQQIDSLGFG